MKCDYMIYLIISILIILVLGLMAYQDRKTNHIKLYTLVIISILSLFTLYLNISNDLYTTSDYFSIGLVTFIAIILILAKQMSIGEIGIIPLVIAMPYLTTLSIFIAGIFSIISNLQGYKKQPFYAMLFVAFICSFFVFYVGFDHNPISVLENPHICSFNSSTMTFSNNSCIKPIVIASYQYERRIPQMNLSFNNTLNLTKIGVD